MLFRQLDWGSKENENINKRVLKSGQAEKREIVITYITSLFQWSKFVPLFHFSCKSDLESFKMDS